MMQILPSCAQHIGKREQQQDAFIFSDLDNAALVNSKGALAVVADGMGGMAMGQEASNLASRVMLKIYNEQSETTSPIERLHLGTTTANHDVFQMAAQAGLAHQVGTTLIAVIIQNGALYWISVGDSRIYLLRNGELAPLNHEHTYARKLNQEVLKGKLKRAQTLFHPERQALTSFIGLTELTEIDANIKPFPLQAGDQVLLCSDGLHGTLSDEEITNIILNHGNDSADALVQATLDRGAPHQDNVTAVLLSYQDSNAPVSKSNASVPLQMAQTTRQPSAVSPNASPNSLGQASTPKRKWGWLVGLGCLALVGFLGWKWFNSRPEGFVYMGQRPDGQTTDLRGYFKDKGQLDEGTLVKTQTEQTLNFDKIAQKLPKSWQLIGIVRSDKSIKDQLVFETEKKDSLALVYYDGSAFKSQALAGKYDDFERFEFFRPYTDLNIKDQERLSAVPPIGKLQLPQQEFMPRQSQWETLADNQQKGNALFDSMTVSVYPEFNGLKPFKKRLKEDEVTLFSSFKSQIQHDKRFSVPAPVRLDDWQIQPLRYADAAHAWLLIFAYNSKLDEWTLFAGEKGKPSSVLVPSISFTDKDEIKLTFNKQQIDTYRAKLGAWEVSHIIPTTPSR